MVSHLAWKGNRVETLKMRQRWTDGLFERTVQRFRHILEMCSTVCFRSSSVPETQISQTESVSLYFLPKVEDGRRSQRLLLTSTDRSLYLMLSRFSHHCLCHLLGAGGFRGLSWPPCDLVWDECVCVVLGGRRSPGRTNRCGGAGAGRVRDRGTHLA